MENISTANHLSGETSPYLRQHMHNPVEWYPWGNEALNKAEKENKLLIISIGYSACHWCHVMERESFENAEVAEVMNKYYVAVKVDREERPDIDHFYMDAMQVLNGNGGWPLNVLALPDGRPFYGGTYFNRDQWISLCNDIAGIHLQRPHELIQYADQLTASIGLISQINNSIQPDFSKEQSKTIFRLMNSEFDHTMGGLNTRNKFPMPVVLDLLLRYYFYSNDTNALDICLLTLDKMSQGGIYDHLAGGFARYSTDKHWKIPHFEKMLYDNAQLIGIYTDAYRITADKHYKEIIHQTINFISRELTSPEYGFYSSLDADSEGEEGKYYVWTKAEFDELITAQRDFLADYFGFNEGAWEDGKYILNITSDFDKLITKYGLNRESARFLIAEAKSILSQFRSERVRLGLDDKILLSWNALMLKALAEAYAVFRIPAFLDLALRNYEFIKKNLIRENRTSRIAFKGESSVAFLDDYANYIDALISLYQATSDQKFLTEARFFTNQCIEDYFDKQSSFFSYTRMDIEEIPVRKYETIDNVIPSSNAVMASNLLQLYAYFGEGIYRNLATSMIGKMNEQLLKHPTSYALWASLALQQLYPAFEVAVVGDKWADLSAQLLSEYLPNTVIASSARNSDNIPVLSDRFKPGETLIYLCQNHTCRLPETDVKKIIADLKKGN